MNVLDQIFANKRQEVERALLTRPFARVRTAAEASPPVPGFLPVLRRPQDLRPRLIAEVKKASPSHGLLVADFDPLSIAFAYKSNGASALSVLTDERYFMGSLDYLVQVATQEPCLPVLRKDFIYHPYQVYEARAAGASAILLIAAMLAPEQLKDLRQLAQDLGMDALVEVHTLAEVEIALASDADLVGVNNRNLQDLSVNLETSHLLRASIPPEICMVAESGIHTRADVDRLGEIGVDAILVGEALVTAPDIAAKVRELSL